MPLGIGGGAFGARGGISTRGVGVGVGPLSAGTSWRGKRSSGGGGLIAWLFAAAVVFFIAAWPFLLEPTSRSNAARGTHLLSGY